jgi:hypothetical protein
VVSARLHADSIADSILSLGASGNTANSALLTEQANIMLTACDSTNVPSPPTTFNYISEVSIRLLLYWGRAALGPGYGFGHVCHQVAAVNDQELITASGLSPPGPITHRATCASPSTCLQCVNSMMVALNTTTFSA